MYMRDSIILGTCDDIFLDIWDCLDIVNLALFIDIALSAELNFTFKWLFLSILIFLTVMERLIYRYGETNLCYGVIFKLKFLSVPSTKVYNI